MKPVFIAGTDTEVGKTVVCGCLLRFALERSINAVTQKWVQTKEKGKRSDLACHWDFAGKKLFSLKKYLSDLNPYSFSYPASPHLASFFEKKKINTQRIKISFHNLKNKFPLVIVEGTGGLLVPLNKGILAIDIVKDLNLTTILVVKNCLGAINHTLLSIEALKRRKMRLLGLIFNRVNLNTADKIAEDNPKIISRLSGVEVLGNIGYHKNRERIYKDFIPAGKAILSWLK